MTRPIPDATLLANLKARMPMLKELLEEADGHWGLENFFYRYYHMSFKVYHAQDLTLRIVNALKGLLPDRELAPSFTEILEHGTGKLFEREHNQRWTQEARPILDAAFHAIFFLRLAVMYGEKLDSPPEHGLPNGYAALLELYGIR
jgi:hypothetical protein